MKYDNRKFDPENTIEIFGVRVEVNARALHIWLPLTMKKNKQDRNTFLQRVWRAYQRDIPKMVEKEIVPSYMVAAARTYGYLPKGVV